MSLFLSWYTVSLSSSNGSQSLATNFYPGQAFNVSATSGSSTTGSTTTYSEAKLTQTGDIYMVLEIFLVLGSILGVTGASLLLAAGDNSPSVKSSGTALVAFAVLIALVGPMMLLVGQPSALAYDSYKESMGNSQAIGPSSSFFGSNSTSTYSASWGPSIGWYLSIVVFVVLAISVALVPGSRPEREATPGPVVGLDQQAYRMYQESPGSASGQPPGQSQWGFAQGPPAMPPPPGGYSQIPGPSYPPQSPPHSSATPPDGYCSYCGTGVVARDSYCRRCGRPVALRFPTVPPT